MDKERVEFIHQAAERRIEYVDRNRVGNPEPIKDLIRQLEKVLLGEASLTDSMINRMTQSEGYYAVDYLQDILNNKLRSQDESIPSLWTIDHPVIQKLIDANHVQGQSSLPYLINYYIARTLAENKYTDWKKFIAFLHQRKFSDETIITTVIKYSSNPFYIEFNDYRRRRSDTPQEASKNELSNFGTYLLPLLEPKKGFLGLGKDTGIKKNIDSLLLEKNAGGEKKYYWVVYLFENYPQGLEDMYYDYLWNTDYNGNRQPDMNLIHFYLDRDPEKFEQLVLDVMKEGNSKIEDRFSVLLRLNTRFVGKYNDELTAIGESHFRYFSSDTVKDHYYHDPYTRYGPLTQAYTEFLWSQNEEKAKSRIDQFLRESAFLTPNYFNYLDKKLNADVVPRLMEALFKNPERLPTNARDYYAIIFKILDKYDIRAYHDRIVDFAVNLADKKSRLLVSQSLTKYADQSIPKATELLSGKTVDQRVTGALILSAIGTEPVEVILNDAVDRENNDDTRDIMLEALREKRFGTLYSIDQVKDMITKADERKKLNKWNEKWIEEDKLPKLYWKGSKTALDQKDIRFLFYRMKRAQGLNSDIEAKQLIHHLDQERSEAFAKATLTAFQNSNADSKLKYYLTLSGLLGGDDMMHSLHALFKKSVVDKRVKMAEYIIGALAMVASDKALRIVESIYRKFANKKPALSLAAQEALTAAASEHAITMDELADRIIPDFDFEGLYKIYTIDGEAYRAFINSEFKLNYFTEDNKLRKSLPSTASKELKAEVKEIEKEINDVIKTQSGRLEKYMLEERRWQAENWRTFFFGNPIMFVYTLKLLWGVYDQQGNLVTVFYCSEDTSLYNMTDEEVVIEDNQLVGIVHPVHLSADELAGWRDKLYTMSMITLFPILERPVFSVDEQEKELSYTKKFFGSDVPKGADFVNTFMVKQNWLKSSGDGGRSEFTKHFKDGNLKAYASIDGPAAFYQGGTTKAKVFEISFMGKSWNDKIALKDIPPVFYSEVMSDIDQLIKAN